MPTPKCLIYSEYYFSLCYSLQVDQEIDLVLGKKDVITTATSDWEMKWTPAVLEHSDNLTGKLGAIFKQNQMACQGIITFYMLSFNSCWSPYFMCCFTL